MCRDSGFRRERSPTAFILPDPTELFPIMEVKTMNNPVDPRKIPLYLERLAKEGYLLDVECSKREIRITYIGHRLRGYNCSTNIVL